jgi:hypothetical protein
MTYGVPVDDDYVAIRDIPARSIMKLMAAMAAGTALFFFVFHMFAWAAGWPGPFLWFGSQSRWSDILSVSLGVPFSIFTASLFGVAVVKSLAMFDWLNFRLRVR